MVIISSCRHMFIMAATNSNLLVLLCTVLSIGTKGETILSRYLTPNYLLHPRETADTGCGRSIIGGGGAYIHIFKRN